MENWISIESKLPPNGIIVETKIANPDRNIQDLKKQNNLWFVPDGSMYVYYTPTHWRLKQS
jgi:hypothetical protein